NRENVSEKEFIAVIRRLMASRPTSAHAGADAEKAIDLKKETADNIIGQSVTNWESLDRHYEEQEPFKWEYEFNYNHRLVLSLEQRLFVPEAKVTDEEIKQEYEEHIGRYTVPTRVKLYLIDETEAPLNQIWADVAVGKKFEDVLKQLELQAKFLDVPANHLDPEVKPMVSNLADGETSQIFSAQGVRVIAHLIERIPEARIPLKSAKESIRSGLWKKKIEQARSAYLEKLKSDSEIEVRKQQWKTIQKELGGL
ncbi:MAG: peptidyl-prolyl cis-trans isomerase, partial [Desulfuromonadales bacterium]